MNQKRMNIALEILPQRCLRVLAMEERVWLKKEQD
jgi:hypothetical protein